MDDVSFTISLRDIGVPVRVAAPPVAQTGGLGSTSGMFLFGTGFTQPAASPAVNSSVTATWSAQLVDGVVQGVVNATSSTNRPLRYSFLGSSAGGKLDIGTVPVSPTETDPRSFTILPSATWLNTGGSKGTETFDVLVGETTAFAQYLTGIPLVGAVATPVIDLLQATPLVNDRLTPTIGASTVASVSIDVAAFAPADTPLAFTFLLPSFDGTLLSTNFFPASGLAAGSTAPTVLNGPGLGSPGQTNPHAATGSQGSDSPLLTATPGIQPLRNGGFNVVTWDPRGEFASGGILQLDNPFFEGRDVSSLMDWMSAQTPATLNGPSDPRVGMVGGSYGGGIQLIAASTDPRIDAIVPDNAWNSLNESLYPGDTLHTTWAAQLLSSLEDAGVRLNDQIAAGLAAGVATGRLSDSMQAMLAASGPTSLLNQLQAPTLLTQSIANALFPLRQAIDNAETILANPYGTPVKMIWYGAGEELASAERTTITQATLAWLDTYVAGNGGAANQVPNFQWFDQAGSQYSSSLLPFEAGFNEPTPISATAAGGTLAISPGAGPTTMISVPLTVPSGMQIVGAPSLSFTYSGQGTSRAVFARIVDTGTGTVLGNIVTPIPVTLDGAEHTVSLPLADVVYTSQAPGGMSVTLQITSSATAFANPSSGAIAISDITISLPTRSMLTQV
jgi:ABC-2 type transport system ATP-binding protein